VKRKAREGLERELARAIYENGKAMKKPKKIRPVKLKRRQGSRNAPARPIYCEHGMSMEQRCFLCEVV